ncbi:MULTISPECIES: AraC family transcriptional regulator [unclassified Rhizobium]|uniref:AraC family transcriptional regulator n=1 Tax=unclassified Rhizobium TaxID=2613769 RepID=UPI000CDF4567|nr:MULTISPECIES: AraC family transcriptional regulator [Rhizobium]AVA19904.1 AraC family transcriptional regulator protein [Rhizobium sp. NXC24]MDK4740973.1 AraC family transcriptional regulator [Rhizobium sp. CNPSo 3464]UWU21219.1 AraC family transcriptional regulator [Rhizobium tropici]
MLDHDLGPFGIRATRWHIAAGLTYIPATPFHRLGIHMGAPVNASCRCDGWQHRRVQSHGDIDIVPAGLDGEWEDDADCTILRLWISPAIMRGAAEDMEIDPDSIAIRPKFQHRDPGIEHIALALETQTKVDEPADRLFVESLGRALAVRLIAGTFDATTVSARQKLSSNQRRRLVEFIESHLDGDLSLAQLAEVAAISVSHLKVLFRRSFGMPVHQYVIRRRVERARHLLAMGELSISQIALAAGFAHQSHMAQAMKRILGITPTGIARMRR